MSPVEYAPQLATLVDAPPSGPGWWHEVKFDGYRIGCRIRGDQITLSTRTGKDWTDAFPVVVKAARELETSDALLDGEVAMILPNGRTSFQALQNPTSDAAKGAAQVYFVFDLLRLDGESLEALPLSERKARLLALVGRNRKGTIRYSEHVEQGGKAFLDQACRHGLEGIVSKRLDRPYHRGRNADWVKAKCSLRQELVIGGFTDPEGTRVGIGALLVGYYDGDRLVYAGKVGTGFSHKLAVDLRQRLDRLERKSPAFDPQPPRAIARRAHWVRPDLVCEVRFTEWTNEGMARHPAFQGLRADKDPRDVRRESPADVPLEAAPARPRTSKRPTTKTAEPAAKAGKAKPEAPVVEGVTISHPDRIVYPDPPTTKLALAQWYAQVAEWILPHVAGRPLTVVRCPDGLAGQCFYMKSSSMRVPAPLRRVPVQEKLKVGEYLVADEPAAIVALIQMGVLEIHTWNSTADAPEKPNRLVIDLDPGERVQWPQVVEAARVVKRALESLDLESFCKTTGGRGVHVVVPLAPHADWDDTFAFARALSEAIEQADAATYTTEFSKRGRSAKILIDYMRNGRGHTSVAAYSTRARPLAPVSVPLTWDELAPSLVPAELSIDVVAKRLSRRRVDPWKGYWTSKQKLTRQRLMALQRR
jgi:bifunctional non-homologous end joining protein LigD